MRARCVAQRLGRNGYIGNWDRRALCRQTSLIDRRQRLSCSRPCSAIGLDRQFDLVQSFEVAEHLPAAKAGQFVDRVTSHGPYVLFSAAVPGQGGENRLNQQPADYWRAIFRERGYAAVDYLRPLIFNDKRIARWYRYNILLYVRDEMVDSLSDVVRQCRVPDHQNLDEYWPLFYRLRHALIGRLPTAVINRLACGKAALVGRRPQAV
jgi:hypothetical protein